MDGYEQSVLERVDPGADRQQDIESDGVVVDVHAGEKREIAVERSESRILMIDVLRGVCVVGMIIAHLPGDPLSRYSNPSFSPVGLFSGVSVFVGLSGWVAGYAFERHRERYGEQSAFRRIWQRAAKLYVAQLLLLCALGAGVVFGFHGSANWQLFLFESHPLKALILGVALLYEPAYLGILPMFCFFLAITPVVLRELRRGHTRRVLASAALIWAIAAVAIRLPVHSEGVNFGGFNPFSYQILYVLGVVLGEKRFTLNSLAPWWRGKVLAACMVITELFFVLRIDYLRGHRLAAMIDHLGPLFSVLENGPLRILNFATFIVVLSWAMPQLGPVNENNRVIRWLMLLGQNSLLVFVFSILYTYAAGSVLGPNASRNIDIFVALALISALTWASVKLASRSTVGAFVQQAQGQPSA